MFFFGGYGFPRNSNNGPSPIGIISGDIERCLNYSGGIAERVKGGPQITGADQKGSLAPKINCVHFNKQPFRLGTGGDWGFRGGDKDRGLIHGDVLQ